MDDEPRADDDIWRSVPLGIRLLIPLLVLGVVLLASAIAGPYAAILAIPIVAVPAVLLAYRFARTTYSN